MMMMMTPRLLLTQQPIDLLQQATLILAPARAVPAELVDDGVERLVLLHREVRDALGRRRRGEDDLVQDLIHALAHDGLVAAAVGSLAHHLRGVGLTHI